MEMGGNENAAVRQRKKQPNITSLLSAQAFSLSHGQNSARPTRMI
jgi:hypothetical protein